jgi:hypothetical protein
MDSYHDGTSMPLLLVLIEATSLISKPFSKCGAFHFGPSSSMIVRDCARRSNLCRDANSSLSLRRCRPLKTETEGISSSSSGFRDLRQLFQAALRAAR